MAKHDENKDVRLISRKVKVDYYNKSISASKDTIIGNRTWGRIDYLCHYCGYHFFWNGNARVIISINNDNDDKKITKKDLKKALKDKSLSNKTAKRKK